MKPLVFRPYSLIARYALRVDPECGADVWGPSPEEKSSGAWLADEHERILVIGRNGSWTLFSVQGVLDQDEDSDINDDGVLGLLRSLDLAFVFFDSSQEAIDELNRRLTEEAKWYESGDPLSEV